MTLIAIPRGISASHYGYFAWVDHCFADAERRYSADAWRTLSDQEQLDALGLGDRVIRREHDPRRHKGPQSLNEQRRRAAARRDAQLLELIRQYPDATADELAQHLGGTAGGVRKARQRLVRAGLARQVAQVSRTRWRYEVID